MNLINKVTEMIDNSSMTYKVVFKNDSVLNLDINTNAEIYEVIRTILREYGLKGEGKCGSGFEFYPLNNGMILAIGWNTDGPNKFHLGQMGKAF